MAVSSPKVSVIMSIYNEAEHLRESVDSILRQTFQYFEIVIVDDGSSDQSPKIIDQLSEKNQRIQSYRLDGPHGDETVPRNYGVKQARGALITFQDGDDWSEPERLAEQVNFLKNHKSIDIVGTNCLLYPPETDQSEKQYFYDLEAPDKLREKFYQVPPIFQATAMMKKEEFLRLGGYRDQPYSTPDFDLWLRALAHKDRVAKLTKALYHYRGALKNYDNVRGRALVSKFEFLLPLHYVNRRPLGIWGTGKAADLIYRGLQRYREAVDEFPYSFSFVVKSAATAAPEEPVDWEQRGLDVYEPEEVPAGNPYFIGGSYRSFNDMFEEITGRGYKQYEDFVFFV